MKNLPAPHTACGPSAVSAEGVTPARVYGVLVSFCTLLARPPLVPAAFSALLGTGDGRRRVARLASACGYPDAPESLCRRLLEILSGSGVGSPVVINAVELPRLLVLAVLELLLPGDDLVGIDSVERLEEVAAVSIPASQRVALQQVIETYPVRLSRHVIRQMRLAPAVARQYLPFAGELDPAGPQETWIGRFHCGLVERMYRNRAILLLSFACPVYCRFCFRKHREARRRPDPTAAEVESALSYIRENDPIKEVLITGGDPLLNRTNLARAVNGLRGIPHVRTVRLGTRSISYHPHLFLARSSELLHEIERLSNELERDGKRLEIGTHFNHPDEISPESLELVSRLVNAGIPVYVQTPLLSGCNDEGGILVRLFSLLRGAGAEMHYVFMPCHPIRGNSSFKTTIARGIGIGAHLRAHLSDRAVPHLCTASPIGKLDWHTTGWAVEPGGGDEPSVWLRTPYTAEYFEEFAASAEQLEAVRINAEGTLDIRYPADIGAPTLFLGPRPAAPERPVKPAYPLERIRPLLAVSEGLPKTLVESGCADPARVHLTRVETTPDCSGASLGAVARDDRITDVLVIAGTDLHGSLTGLERIATLLRRFPHVSSLRLRSLHVAYEPHDFSSAVIKRLQAVNRVAALSPLRLEIETQFLAAREITDVHIDLARRLNNAGITVYNNTPLLGRINDSPERIRRLAAALRQASIEFHHLYVAGTALQERWNALHPVALHDVVDICSQLRREGSGREIPHVMIRTGLGEVDFGLCSTFVQAAGTLKVKLLPYDLGYFQAIAPGFRWPEGIEADDDDVPLVPLHGVLKESDFPLC